MVKKALPKLVAVSLLTIFIFGCATSRKVQVVQMGDNQLTCQDLIREMDRLDEAQADVDSKKGVTGTNVAAALFWLPGLAYTYYDSAEATKLISERKSHLTDLFNRKGCRK